jgi:2-amino-4-hydroxy-6-hydroxymethyldihydropteridine diphosphokinase
MNKAYLLLGSNLSDPQQQLQAATTQILIHIGEMIAKSSLYLTAAWGNNDQPDFMNQVVIIKTKLPVAEVLKIILLVEKNMGRIRTEKNAPRKIDIDIIYFNHEIINLPELTVPHPALHLRRFVLVPLNEVAPKYIHPVFGKTTEELLSECADHLDVKRF